MEWNAKWDWENVVMFNSKAIMSPKKVQPTDWGLEEGVDVEAISFNLSGGGSGGSASDLGFGSSAKSSISASTGSSPEGIKTSNFSFETFESFAGGFNKKKDFTGTEPTGTSPPLEASVGSGEPLIGLKLGKRTYFENHCPVSNAKSTSFSAIPVPSAASAKRMKSSTQTPHLPRCQVEGCNLDLSSAKDYHRKHRVCESHSKCPKVIITGLERRFCQQCSRFHSLSEFDEKKRSCRRRLSDHNARRRKPQQEAIQFNSRRLSSSFYDGSHQMSFGLNSPPLVHTDPVANLTWESTRNSKFTLTRGCRLEPEKAGGVDGLLSHDSNRFLPCKGPTVFSQGLKDSTLSSNLDAAPDLHRALSLLSTNSWGSQPEPVHHPMHVNHYTTMPQPVLHEVPQGLPSDYWQDKQHLTDSRVHALASADSDEGNNHFQDVQMFKMPFSTSFYANPPN